MEQTTLQGAAHLSASACSCDFSPVDLVLIGITTESVGIAFSWGFGAVATSWFLGFCIRTALSLVRKL